MRGADFPAQGGAWSQYVVAKVKYVGPLGFVSLPWSHLPWAVVICDHWFFQTSVVASKEEHEDVKEARGAEGDGQ